MPGVGALCPSGTALAVGWPAQALPVVPSPSLTDRNVGRGRREVARQALDESARGPRENESRRSDSNRDSSPYKGGALPIKLRRHVGALGPDVEYVARKSASNRSGGLKRWSPRGWLRSVRPGQLAGELMASGPSHRHPLLIPGRMQTKAGACLSLQGRLRYDVHSSQLRTPDSKEVAIIARIKPTATSVC